MPHALDLHPDRLFPVDPTIRRIARDLHGAIKDLPILSPHGHTDPAWFATNASFGNATDLLLVPDHYIFRMLYSQGVSLQTLGIGGGDVDPREAWRAFASHYYLPAFPKWRVV